MRPTTTIISIISDTPRLISSPALVHTSSQILFVPTRQPSRTAIRAMWAWIIRSEAVITLRNSFLTVILLSSTTSSPCSSNDFPSRSSQAKSRFKATFWDCNGSHQFFRSSCRHRWQLWVGFWRYSLERFAVQIIPLQIPARLEHLVRIFDKRSRVVFLHDRRECSYMNDIILARVLGRKVFGERVQYAEFGVGRKVTRRREVSAVDIESHQRSVYLVFLYVGG